MKTDIVKAHDILSAGFRTDASYHLSEGVEVKRQIALSPYPCITVGDVASRIFHAGRWKRSYVSSKEHGIELIGSSDMLQADLSDIKLISRKYTPDIEDKKLKRDWILISCSGTIGNTVYTTNQHAEKLASQHVIRIIPNNILRTGFVYSFLSTSYGYNLLTQGTFGAVIQHINPEHLENIPIPNAPENLKRQIHELIVKSYALRDESNDLIDEATQILISELELPDIDDFQNEKIFSVNVKNLFGRLDASYHAPIVSRLVEHLKKHAAEVTTIGNSRISKKIILAGVFKRVYVEKEFGYPFLGGKEITQLNPKTEKFLSKAIHKSRYEKENPVQSRLSGHVAEFRQVPTT